MTFVNLSLSVVLRLGGCWVVLVVVQENELSIPFKSNRNASQSPAVTVLPEGEPSFCFVFVCNEK